MGEESSGGEQQSKVFTFVVKVTAYILLSSLQSGSNPLFVDPTSSYNNPRYKPQNK